MIGLYLKTVEFCKMNPLTDRVVYDHQVREAGGRPEALRELCRQAGITAKPFYGGCKFVYLPQGELG